MVQVGSYWVELGINEAGLRTLQIDMWPGAVMILKIPDAVNSEL